MAEEFNTRRSFIKRAGIAASVFAGSAVAVAATTQSRDRGEGSDSGHGVAVGIAHKKEVLYKKTQAWSAFYNAAK
ncbi:formate dehydrogenase [Candidatus Marinarcus aquaticus]|uniref:Formate dehydrogenase n=1 Tax=Candidatus Marinarcus aquaticus TaxID=2044504 RepID=A0A4Q0XVU9_9BACT|nr:formate dehydrogenase [Candidatus Marinarcus aquaticus]RXJ60784.1 formate dehydrogenase [Candidatus Marinarcus aquaticus]